jgi:hypothetical protein
MKFRHNFANSKHIKFPIPFYFTENILIESFEVSCVKLKTKIKSNTFKQFSYKQLQSGIPFGDFIPSNNEQTSRTEQDSKLQQFQSKLALIGNFYFILKTIFQNKKMFRRSSRLSNDLC